MNTPLFNPFPILETPRLILRQPAPGDAADLFEMRSDPQVMQFIPRPLARTLDDIHDFIGLVNEFAEKSERINWAIESKADHKVVGMVGFVNLKPDHSRAELGYSLTRAWHRRGIMSEAVQAVIRYGFDVLQLHSIEAIIDEQNIPSGALLEAAGFRREAHFIEDFFYEGRFRNSVHFGLLKREWEKSTAAESAAVAGMGINLK